LILTALAGCDKNPTKPEPDKPADSVSDSLSTLVVIFEDDKGNPVDFNSSFGLFRTAGVEYSKEYMFQNGKARIDSLPPGSYTVTFSFYDPVSSGGGYIYYANDVVVMGNKINETKFILPSEVEYNIFLTCRTSYKKDKGTEKYMNIPVPGAVITTIPETIAVTSDAQGCATLGTFPLREFYFIVSKKNMTFTERHFTVSMYMTNGKFELVLLFSSYQPIVEIISPIDNEYLLNKNIHLHGVGYYLTDEPLSDYAFTWYSDIDGELGKGKEITVESLSMGHHTITLVGSTSPYNKNECSIKLNISFFDDESYFPLPYSGYWNYHYNTTDFSVIDEIRGAEYWTLTDLQVSADDINTRNCLMEYTITKGDITKYCRYYVVDQYETDSENIYITRTTEQIHIFEDENTQGEPIEQLDIETVYSPHYLLIKQYMNPSTESSYGTSVSSDITWEYQDVNSTLLTFAETIDISTSYEIGEIETIATEIGTFEAVPLTIYSEDTVRKWWLARGTGIIQLEHDAFDFPLTATLYDTNIFTFSESGQAKKSTPKLSFYGENRLQKVFKSPPDTPERMLELCRLLRGLCPR